MEKIDLMSADIVASNVEKIGRLFPSCITECKNADGKVERVIDFDKLRDELSQDVVEGSEERYQFTWPDKRKYAHLANIRTDKTLRPCREESVDFDHTKNLYIEGDNLEVLKVMRETYLGKVKMIYIDPPYNTGQDFVYRDKFVQSVDDFLENSGQYDEDNNQLVENTDANGRFHTDWLNMLYPRLKLARNLLAQDGVIFISIDDNEQANLKKICDEVFGEKNFAGQFPWRKRTAKSDVPFGISQDYEWILCYAKTDKYAAAQEGGNRKYFETDDLPGRPWRIHDLTTQRNASERPNSFFTIINPKTGKEYPANPNRVWAVTKETIEQYFAEKRIVFPGDYDFLNISKPALRYFKEDDMKKAGEQFGYISVSTKLPDEIGMTQDGTKEIVAMFDNKVFGFPKSVALIKHLIKISTSITNNSENIILDFFSGSATAGQAVMQLNAEDGGNRKFIMVQLPDSCDEKSEAFKAGYKNICEIGKERIRRAGKKIKEDNADNPNIDKLDTGFRVLKLDTSNMESVKTSPQETSLDLLKIDNVKPDRTPEDLLFQVMLRLGIELSADIKTESINDQQVFFVNGTYLAVCFDPNLKEETLLAIAKEHPQYCVIRDSSYADENIMDNFEAVFKQFSPTTECKVI